MIIRLFSLLVLLLAGSSCKTQKRVTTRSDIQTLSKDEVTLTSKQQAASNLDSLHSVRVKGANLHYNFTLKSTQADQPAKVVEWRQGAPYRVLEATNAEYREESNIRDSSTTVWQKKIIQQMKASHYETQLLAHKIDRLHRYHEKAFKEGRRVATNIKYLILLLAMVAGIWFVERTGLTSLIKRLVQRE